MERSDHTIDQVLADYLDDSYHYDFWSNPDVVQSREDAIRFGVNCISLAHLALRDLYDVRLPSELRCAEMYRDNDYFQRLPIDASPRVGDLYWFGVQSEINPETFKLEKDSEGNLVNWQYFPVKHVAVLAAYDPENKYLLHATHREGRKNQLWELDRFAKYYRYEKLYGISRLRSDDGQNT